MAPQYWFMSHEKKIFAFNSLNSVSSEKLVKWITVSFIQNFSKMRMKNVHCDPITSRLDMSVLVFFFPSWFISASQRYNFLFTTLLNKPVSQNDLFTVDIQTILFCWSRHLSCEASLSQIRHTNVFVLMLSCAPGPPTPLSVPVRGRFVLLCEASCIQTDEFQKKVLSFCNQTHN